jgi:hypothetical protein
LNYVEDKLFQRLALRPLSVSVGGDEDRERGFDFGIVHWIGSLRLRQFLAQSPNDNLGRAPNLGALGFAAVAPHHVVKRLRQLSADAKFDSEEFLGHGENRASFGA